MFVVFVSFIPVVAYKLAQLCFDLMFYFSWQLVVEDQAWVQTTNLLPEAVVVRCNLFHKLLS